MLPVVMEAPATERDWEIWFFNHRDSHDRIRQRIAADTGVLLPDYPIGAVRMENFKDFLEFNSLLHTDMNLAVRAQGSDLQDLDPNDRRQLVAWSNLHWLEHQLVEQRLGL